ncbi:MAG: hypothetical protein HY820_42490 [Acidobacteria bacterium]|nr:hypothetical protein [Acidobacteriota bacterium]
MSFRRFALFALVLGAASMHADLPSWVRFLEANSRQENALFRAIDLPGGPIAVRRPAREATAELTKLIAATPTAADLFSLRAHEAETLLDFAAAEADWKKYAELSGDKFIGLTALADYYYRRAQVPEEMRTLSDAAALASPDSERFTPAARQRSWMTYERMLARSQRQLLPAASRREVYQKWNARYPREAGLYLRWMNAELAAKDFDQAARLLAEYPRRFPGDTMTVTTMTAELERARGNTDKAIAVYNTAFQPLWPRGLYNNFFSLLRDTRTSRKFLADARAAATASPLALDPVARQFHYHLHEGHSLAAQRVLVEFRRRKEATPNSWTATELRTMAQLWNNYGNNRNETARYYYALYSLKGASDAEQEEGLAGIATMLLAAPDQPLALGNGDLSFYQDIATADPYPGFLNGILSLVLNSSEPASRYAGQEQQAVPYFQRARASELIDLFERRFPRSNRRAALRYALLSAYAVHGEDDAVISGGRRFLTDFPTQAQRTNVSLLVADSYARKNQVPPELAMYDALLAELAKRAEGMPLGVGLLQGAAKAGPRSADYARVLDRYISRLVSLQRTNDALTMMRREIDRNPTDPGLYERLAGFLAQNKIYQQQEAVYKLAISRFQDKSWSHKLARFYLGVKQQQQFAQHTNEVIKIFSGTELESYFREVVGKAQLDRVLYRQLNLFALARFPRNLTFVDNLLRVYTSDGTRDSVAYENLLRRYWFHSDALRARFFAHLSATGKLGAEFQSLQTAAANVAANPVQALFVAEAQAWWSHFEQAGPLMASLAKATPGDMATGQRAASLARSLAAFDARSADDAVALETNLAQAAPRDSGPRTRIGEIGHDYPRANLRGSTWAQIPAVEPGVADHYVEAATIHWDYFEYGPALNLLNLGRQRLRNESLFAYEAGAIRENQRQMRDAIEEYVKGSLAQPGGSLAQSRLLVLANRASSRQMIDDATSRAAAGNNPPLNALTLRIALLESQNRKSDLEAWLLNLAASTQNFELLRRVNVEGRRLEFPRVEERAVLRQIELSADPLDKLELRLTLARAYEEQKNVAAAARTIDALQRENPMILGILRAAVNYHSRNGNEMRAVELLTNAAPSAHDSIRPKLELEAARRATSTGQYAQARQLLTRLLDAQPYEASYLAAMADTYARANDDAGLRAFYQDRIAMMLKAQLPATERMERVASLRRSLIPVLTRSNDYVAAIDQYIEVLNRYPEDVQLTGEISLYARQRGQQQRLLNYYEKTAAASPRDFRFPMILARVQTKFEDFDSAIRWYTKASEIRPDRTDLLAARGDLEERLLRFDDAVTTFTKVYDLSFQRSTWMERVALVRARQQRPKECVAALETALLTGRSDSPDAQLDVARRLDQWGMPQLALPYAEKGLAANGVHVYAAIATRLGRYREAFQRGNSNKELLPSMAAVVKQHFTPQQKTEFGVFLDSINADPQIGQQAGMPEWHAKRLGTLLANGSPEVMTDLILVQTSRLRYAELGRQLEDYAGKKESRSQDFWSPAARAYRLAGDAASEVRVLANTLDQRGRYYQLLAASSPNQLIQLSARVNDAVNAALQSGNAALTLSAVAARGRALPPVWTKANTALAGLYFGLRSPDINAAFQQALGTLDVRPRLSAPADRRQQLVGDVWYGYGSRYGEYLDFLRDPSAEDYHAATVEASPGNASAYVRLADYYRESGRARQAIQEYDSALQLNPRDVAALYGSGVLLWSQNQRDQAKARWRMAINAASELLSERRQSADLPDAITALSATIIDNKLRVEFGADFDRMAARTIDRYNLYTLTELWKSIDVGWLISMSRSLSNPVPMLQQALEDEKIPEARKEEIYTRLMEVAALRGAQTIGDSRNEARNDLFDLQQRFLRHLLDRKQTARAKTVIASLDQPARDRLGAFLAQARLRIAAAEGRLTAELERPMEFGNEVYREAAIQLEQVGDIDNARRLKRFFYEKELEYSPASAPNLMGLAEVMLESGETEEAARQLRRLTLTAEPAFGYQKDAGLLLRRFGKRTEALAFLQEAAKAMPWDESAKRELTITMNPPPARAQRSLEQLEAEVAANPDDSSLKIEYFDAAFAAGKYAQAVGAAKRLAQVRIGFEDPYRDPMKAEFLPDIPIPAARRAEMARRYAVALENVREPWTDPGELLWVYNAALGLAPNAEVSAAIKRITEASRVYRINDARRPIFGDELRLDRLVRPMVSVGGAQ